MVFGTHHESYDIATLKAGTKEVHHILDKGIDHVNIDLAHHLGEIAQILFFLMGAMTIVELVDAHQGFKMVTDRIQTKSKRKLLWITSWVTFFLSAILDNLTSTIVMISLLRKLVQDDNERKFFVGMVVIAANAGGAWSPIGDVTTTMLWIGGQITPWNIIEELFLPSVVSLAIPLIYVSFMLKGELDYSKLTYEPFENRRNSLIMLAVGLLGLIFVPVFKTLTHLPPYVGMLMSLSILWVVSEVLNSDKDEEERHYLSVSHALSKIDTSSILFFLGILIAISSLESTHVLRHLAEWMSATIGNLDIIVIAIGLASAVIDNVPLVAATMGMYPLELYPTDHKIWEFLAYCAGTGGSVLIIGSAAGVAAMGMEKIDFFWYVKKVSFTALIGYFAGALTYLAVFYLLTHWLFFIIQKAFPRLFKAAGKAFSLLS